MNKVYLGIIAILACACVCVGQTSKGKKEAPLADDPQKGRQVTLMSDAAIAAELQKTIDVNNAKVGDQVLLKTTQSVRQNGVIVVPKGARLIGRVTEVQRRTKDNAQSRIGMVFDQIQGKELSIPLSATITSITNVAARGQLDDTFISDVSGSSQSTASTSRPSSSAGGGLLGGATQTVGGLVNTTTQTVGNVTNTAGQTLGSTTGTVGRTVNGIQISTEASGSANASTTLSSPNKNLRVEKGSTFHLRVAN